MTSETSSFLEHLELVRNLSPRTVSGYRRDLCDLEEFVGGYLGRDDYRWRDIDRGVIRAFVGESGRRGLAASTVARKLAAIRAFFRHLHREGQVPANPAKHVRGPRPSRVLPGHMRAGEARDLLRWAERNAADRCDLTSTRLLAVLELLYGSGLRLAELVSLDVASLDMDRLTLRVLGKGRKERIVPFTEPAALAVRRYLRLRAEAAAPDCAALLVGRHGRRLSRRYVQYSVRFAIERFASLAGLSVHSMRHTFATHLLDAGADIMAVKEMLGHASLATTQIYAHTSKERLRRAYRGAHPRA